MIYNFSAENFYSIGKKVGVNFQCKDKSVGASELYAPAALGNRVSKISFVGGANASGKTNLLRALPFLRYLIIDSMQNSHADKTDSFTQFSPYKGTRSTKMAVTFSIGKNVYYYQVEMTLKRILGESLECRRLVTKRVTASTIFKREWNEEKKTYSIFVSDSLKTIKALTFMQDLADSNPNASFIAIFANYDAKDGILRDVTNFWEGVVSNIQMFGNVETNHSMTVLSNNSLKEIYSNKGIREKVTDILKKYDIGFSNIVKKEKQGANQDKTIYIMEHQYGNNARMDFSMNNESSGTQRMVLLLEIAATALLNKNGVAVIDELDAFLHPDIYEEIIKLFSSESSNPNNSQLIFSSQNYIIMSRLDKSQIILTEKNKENGETEAWRLDEMTGVHSRDNFYLKYLTGAYGGTPEVK